MGRQGRWQTWSCLIQPFKRDQTICLLIFYARLEYVQKKGLSIGKMDGGPGHVKFEHVQDFKLFVDSFIRDLSECINKGCLLERRTDGWPGHVKFHN